MTRTVLHVLPHPGGGGETYVNALAKIDGYHATRVFLAGGPEPRAALAELPRSVLQALRQARRHDLVHVHGEVAAALSLPSLATRPSVLTLHGLNLLRRTSGMSLIAARTSLRLIVRAASKTICVSESEYSDVVDRIGSEAARRVVVIRNGVRTPMAARDARAAVRSELQIPSSAAVILFVGSLEAVKDPLTAVRAAREASRRGVDLRLVVAGEGELRRDVEREGGEIVKLLGFRNDVERLLSAADLLVLSSLREALPYVVLEAMAAGVVPVISDVPGPVEAAGEAGVTAPVRDVAAFADVFVRLLTDANERARLSSLGGARVAEQFREDVMVERTAAVYEAVIGASSRSSL